MRLHRLIPLLAAALAAAGCGGKGTATPSCSVTGCSGGQVCEPVVGRPLPLCFDPVYLSGRVYNLADSNASTNGVSGARVVGQDVDGAPVSAVAITANGGTYELKIGGSTPRNPDGTPASGSVTLRADAAGYEAFPSGLRTALPIALTSATHASGRWTVSATQSSLVDVGLKPLAAPVPAGKISGTVALPSNGGALVVAECGGTAYTAVPGSDGGYEIFNVPNVSCTVTAYAKGVNYTPVNVTISAGSAETANLAQSAVQTATVNGDINFVSKTAWNYTSVMLVVASTFDAARVRGIAPPGLAVHGLQGPSVSWAISGVPEGHYRALAAFETDYIVRDPSNTGGTAIPEFWVKGGSVYLTDPTGTGATPVANNNLGSFKVTGAVRLTAPFADASGNCHSIGLPLPADPGTLPVGGCTSTGAPTLEWEKYSSANDYVVTVVDETGTVRFTQPVPQANPTVSITPTGLTAGTTYQVRVRARPTDPTATISTSEDLLGVFTVK